MTVEGPDGTRGFEAALAHLDEQIRTGALRTGDRLPPERELAAELGLSRGAVREAVRVLQAQGILVSATGPGNGSRIQPAPVSAIGRILELNLALDSHSFADLTATRVALERSACAAAAARRLPEPLAHAKDLLAQMHAEEDIARFNELDTELHVALAEIGGNQLVRDLTVAIRRALQARILRAEQELPDWAAVRENLNRQHTALLARIEAGDVEGAAAAADEHIVTAYGVLSS